MKTQRRMLHAKISKSIQVNRLSVEARLVFTWMIAHADEYGRLRGEAEFIRACVVPMTEWTNEQVEKLLQEIADQKLIYRWTEEDECVIEFKKWFEHQTLRKDRMDPPTLPEYKNKPVNQLTDKWLPIDTQKTAQANKSEPKRTEVKKSDHKETQPNDRQNGFAKVELINPKSFEPSSNEEIAMLEAWRKLEPSNPMALTTTYFTALKKGLPASKFYEFSSEISQDKTINNKGAVFNSKVKSYLNQ
jgi:hypothetical protein